MGTSEITEPAHRNVQSVEFSPRNEYMPTGIVRSSGLDSVNTSGMKKLFQALMHVNRPTVAIMGPDSGSITRQNVWLKLAPSTLAASSISRSIVEKYPMNRNVAKTSPLDDWTMITAHNVLSRPSPRTMSKIGMIV